MAKKLFIGRWMPFHQGHKYIVDSFLNRGAGALKNSPTYTTQSGFVTKPEPGENAKLLSNAEISYIAQLKG
tara:strand:+ start:2635 stop:2847 length:213 start_codon:yes stop_codon:yes gene_type:complete